MSLTRNNACIELLLLVTKMKSLVVHSRLFVCLFVCFWGFSNYIFLNSYVFTNIFDLSKFDVSNDCLCFFNFRIILHIFQNYHYDSR